MKYIKPYKAWFILGPLCMIIEVVGEMFMPLLLANVINAGNAGTLTVGSSIGTAALLIGIPLFFRAKAILKEKMKVRFADGEIEVYQNGRKTGNAEL